MADTKREREIERKYDAEAPGGLPDLTSALETSVTSWVKSPAASCERSQNWCPARCAALSCRPCDRTAAPPAGLVLAWRLAQQITGPVTKLARTAQAIGDDTLQRQTQGRVVPEAFTHGSSEQRVRWFNRGLETGDMNQCDTFSTQTL